MAQLVDSVSSAATPYGKWAGKRCLQVVLMCVVVCAGSACGSNVAVSNSLCVMTYNLRFATNTPPHAWSQRRPLMVETIRGVSPDLIGTQEGYLSQLNDLAADLLEYSWVGTGREGGNKGEFMAVFYRKSRLELLATNYYWLSDTPEVAGSSTWGNHHPRMVAEFKFRDLKSRQSFYVLDTHLDHKVDFAKIKGAALIRQRVVKLGDELPTLLLGDFNSGAGMSEPFSILTEGGFFQDLWKTAGERRGEGINTFNGFKPASTNGVRIDWILARGMVTAERAEVVTYKDNAGFASDHFPVAVWLQLNAQVQSEIVNN